MINEDALRIINMLEEHGYKAYLVGGCVRDILMEKIPYDYDICTNAKPEQIKKVFSTFRTVDCGEKHGTIAVKLNDNLYEITGFRAETKYTDHRRPDSVEYVDDLNQDLKRRDFTINAMAYSPKEGLIDLFGGREDIKNKIIRCVGDPNKRFNEDSLRMLRALRFSSTIGFKIDKDCSKAIKKLASQIKYVSKERQAEELKKILMGENPSKVIRENKELIFAVIPEFKNTYKCTQETKYHKFDVFEHSLKSLSYTPKSLNIRLAMLLHDIAKPMCKTIDSKGIAHFKGHIEQGADLAQEILKDLRFDNKTVKYVAMLIANHSTKKVPLTDIDILNRFRLLGKVETLDLLTLIYCDLLGKSDYTIGKEKKELASILKRAKELEDKTYKISQLAITGDDIKGLGIIGKEVGKTLEKLILLVINGTLENKKDVLINYVKDRL